MDDLSIGVDAISGGTTRAAGGEVVFSNSNNVSFGINGRTVTATVTLAGAGPFVSAAGVSTGGNTLGNTGTQTGTIVLAGINGITLSQSTNANGATVTISGITQSVQPGVTALGVSTGGNTAGDTGTRQGTVVLAGMGAATLSQATAAGGGTISISVPVQSTQPAVNLAAGTQTATSGTIVLFDSNGISFGMSGSTRVTASFDGVRSVVAGTRTATGSQISFANSNGVSFGVQTNDSVLTASIATSLTNINVSAGTTSNNLSAITFSNSNNVSFGLNGSTLTASVTVASTQGSINLSAGTTSNLASAFTFANGNGVSFGLDASTITASIATSLTNIRVSAGTTSNLLSAITFANSNGVTFGLDASTLTASHNGLTTQTNQQMTLFATGNTTQSSTGTTNASSLIFRGAGAASVGITNGSIVISSPAAAANFNISAGTTSNDLTNVVFSNSNNVSFGLNGSTVTASASFPSETPFAISAGAQSVSTGTLVFSNSNRMTFGMSGSSRVTGSFNVGLTATGNTIGGLGTSATSNEFSVSGAGIVSVGFLGNAGDPPYQLVISATQSTGPGGIAAGGVTATSGTVIFSNSNGVSFGLNGQTMTASHNGITSQTNQQMTLFATGNTTQSSTGTTNASSVIFRGEGVASVGITNGSIVVSVPAGGNVAAYGVSNLGNSAGDTGTRTGTMVFAGVNGITLSQSTGAASNTISIMGPRVSVFSHPGDWHATNFTISNATLSLHKFSVPNVITATRIQVLMDLTGNSNSSGALSMSFAFYTLSGSTASLATSGSRELSWTSGSETSASTRYGGVSGTQFRTIALNATVQPGDYLLGVWFRTTNNGTWRIWGRPAVNIVNLHEGTDAWMDGTTTASFTTAMPASIHLSNYAKTGAAALRQPGFILLGTV